MKTWSYRHGGLLVCSLISLGLLSLALKSTGSGAVPEWILFVGRFHLPVLHIPIGILTAAFFLELASWIPGCRHLREAIPFTLALGASSAVIATVLGWCLSQEGGYHEGLLQDHRRMGIATTVAAVWALYFRMQGNTGALRGGLFLYRVLLVITMVCLSLAGHYGGSLTHGSNYLFKYMPPPLRDFLRLPAPEIDRSSEASLQDPAIYPDIVQPLFASRCTECHGPEKNKGDLRLDSYQGLMRGGDLGPAVVPGNPDESELIFFITLPPDDEDVMPPADKQPLSPEEIQLLTWWVQQGASPDARLSQLEAPKEITRFIKRRAAVRD